MRVLFHGVKGTGHVNPTLPIVEALVAAGHEVAYSVTEAWRSRIEGLGARFLNMGETADFTVSDYHPGDFPRGVLPAAVAITPRLLAEARGFGPDVIVYDTFAVWGRLIAEALGVPSITSVTTLLPDGPDGFGVLAGLDEDPAIAAAIETIATTYGPRLSWTQLPWLGGDRGMTYSCAGLNPLAAQYPGHFEFVGPTRRGQGGDAALRENGLEEALRTDRTLIYVAFGSLAARIRGLGPDFFRQFVDAFATRDDVTLVLGVGTSVDPAALGPVPPHVFVRQWVAQDALLAHARVFVSHMGANSTHESLLHDVPMVCVPCFAEQPHNAARVCALGAGLLLPLPEVSVERIRSAVDAVLSDPTYAARAATLGVQLRATPGVARAVTLIEATAARGV